MDLQCASVNRQGGERSFHSLPYPEPNLVIGLQRPPAACCTSVGPRILMNGPLRNVPPITFLIAPAMFNRAIARRNVSSEWAP
jgi:hypothetical protein